MICGAASITTSVTAKLQWDPQGACDDVRRTDRAYHATRKCHGYQPILCFVQGQSELQIMDIILVSLLAQTFIILQFPHMFRSTVIDRFVTRQLG